MVFEVSSNSTGLFEQYGFYNGPAVTGEVVEVCNYQVSLVRFVQFRILQESKGSYKCARSKYLLCKSVWCNSVLHFKMKQFKYFIFFFLILNKIIEFSCDKNRNKRWLLTLGSIIVNIAGTWTFRFRTYFLNG